jgi:hypothetical protein
MKRSTLNVLVAMVLLADLPSLSVAATEIQFWHAMTAVPGERQRHGRQVQRLAERLRREGGA